MDDVILITIDCWRHDAPDKMPQLRNVTECWNSGHAICSAAATNGVFPSLLSSRLYPETYRDDGSVPTDLDSLPAVLQEHGYSTGGFVASNPFLGKWSEHFDRWWNDGMSATEADANRATQDEGLLRKIQRISRLHPHTPAEEVLSRADSWWDNAESPRFLWVHLMEPHGPYLPGFNLGREIGLLRSYASIAGHAMFDEEFPTWMASHLKQLHHQCNRRLDDILSPWLETHKDSTLIVTGDHGEEFDHGLLKHARLYDETVRVPLFTNLFDPLSKKQLIRQLDLAPALLTSLGIKCPEDFRGSAEVEQMPPQPMINSSPLLEQTWVGIRSPSYKLIKTYDWDEGFQQTEAYNLESDPAETEPISESEVPDNICDKLDVFISEPSISDEISSQSELKTGLDSEVQSRLKELGYVD